MSRFVNRKVTPSYIGTRPMGATGHSSIHDETYQLMLGEVKEVIEATDERSLSKKYKEYNVDVQHRDGSGPMTVVRFPNCQPMSLFGSAADRFQYTLRADATSPNGKEVATTGSKVLLLCLNGSGGQAFVIGGIRDDEVLDETGLNLFYEFNGISFSINKDGEASMRFRGPTKIDGSLDTDAGADEKNGPTSIDLLKNGNLHIYTKDQKQSILVDHENNSAQFDFGAWTCNSGSTITLHAQDKCFIKSAGLEVGQATDNMLKGTTYRTAEQALHQQLLIGLQALGAALSATAAALAAGPAASAAAPLAPAIAACTSMAISLQTFEGQAPTFLSEINKLD